MAILLASALSFFCGQTEAELHQAAQSRHLETALEAIRALAKFPTEKTRGLLGKLAANKRLSICVTAIDSLGAHRTPHAVPIFRKTVHARPWPVRAATIRALAALKEKESVDLLIERMEKETGRLLGDIGEALRVLTGKALGFDSPHWKEWWKVNRARFVFPEKAEGVGGAAGGSTTYYGLPVFSKRIVFCLDVSGSMSAPIGSSTRLEEAKKALLQVLKDLARPKARRRTDLAFVNLIFFDHKVEPWRRGLVPIKAQFSRASKRISALRPRGGTNIYDTLEKAFEDREVDTIYLLSDGAPGAGKFRRPDEILREIRKNNTARQITIHTISLGKSAFMRRLAEENGGRYVEK